MTIAAIVVTHNSAGEIRRCLGALEDAGVSVFVVDNASSDATVEVVSRRFPHVRLLANAENRGFAAAVNQALAHVTHDAVLLVNPDCVVPPTTVQALVRHLADDCSVGIVAPRITDGAGATAMSAHPFESLASVVASRFGGALLPLRVRRTLSRGRRRQSYDACRLGVVPHDVDWVSGACVCVRASLLRTLGGLDERYFMYYEDEELCLQAWRAGARVVYLPGVSAEHAGGASSGDPAYVWPHLYRSLLRFQARHRPHTYGAVRAAIVVRAVVGIAVGLPRDVRRARAWACIGAIALRATRAAVTEAR